MRVGIVGGGITGLALHHYLRERGVDSTLWEAADRPGGVIESDRVEGRVIDVGPQRTRLAPSIDSLIGSLDLRDRLLTAPDRPLFVYHDGALGRVPRTVREAVTTDLLSWRGKLRALLEPVRGPPAAGESVHGYLTRAFGPEAARRLGGPLYAGLYASDPREMPVEHSLARALDRLGVGRSVLLSALRSRLRGRDPPPAITFDDGLATLPRALYERHRESIHLNRAVTDVRRSGDCYRLETGAGGATVEAVVLTTPAYVTGRLLRGIDGSSSRALDDLTYNPLVVVHLRSEAGLDCAGYQIALSEDLVTRGVTANDALFDRDGVYTCYLGGATAPESVSWSEERLGRVATREFRQVTGCGADVLSVRRWPRAMPAYDRSWNALDVVDPPEGIHLCANYESRAGIPGRIRAAKRLAASLADQPDAVDAAGEDSRPVIRSDP